MAQVAVADCLSQVLQLFEVQLHGNTSYLACVLAVAVVVEDVHNSPPPQIELLHLGSFLSFVCQPFEQPDPVTHEPTCADYFRKGDCLVEWLDSFGDELMSEEAGTFMYMLEALDESGLWPDG